MKNPKVLDEVQADAVLEYATRKAFEENLADYNEMFLKDVSVPIYQGSND